MGMIIANNLNAFSAYLSLDKNQSSLAQSLTRLSTGYKINTGKDFPAGLVISEQLRAQNIGLERAVQNTQEANNVLGIAEGALNEMNNILKKMTQLTVHSANNGVTSPEQVAADQAEIDSSIQTIDRIARTTKYSDEFLLNGNKKIKNDTTTMVNNTLDMKLLDNDKSDFSQIFKKEDYQLNIAYASSDTGVNEAQKAHLELSAVTSPATQFNNSTYELSQDQSFTISGSGGSRYMSFASGTHIGEMVSSINNAKESTGVEATLIYDADVESTSASATVHTIGDSSIKGSSTATADAALGSAHESGSMDFFMRDENGNLVSRNGITAIGIDSEELTPAGTSSYGYNLSADSLEDLSSFTTDGSTDSDKIITMQFSEIFSSDLSNNEIILKVESGTINAYDSTGTNKLNSGNATLTDGKYDITLDQNLASGKTGKIYIGYDSVTPAASSISPADNATRPFAGNGIWKDSAAIEGNINFDLVTDIENAAMLGAGNTIILDEAGILSQFNLSGGNSSEALDAVKYNIQQALKEWEQALTNVGFNVNFNYANGGLNDGNDGDDPLGAVVDPIINYTNTIRIGMTNMEETSSKEAGVAATGGYSGDNNNKFGAVVFDSNDSWDIKDSSGNTINMDAKVSTGGGDNINFYDVIMHEIGHVLGFAHPENLYGANGLMSYNNTSSSGNVFDAGTSNGAILNADGSFRDPFIEDALNSFYNPGNASITTTKITGPLENGDEIKLILTNGPSGSGFSGASVQPDSAAITINDIKSGGVYIGGDAETIVQALNSTHVADSEVAIDPSGQIVAGYNTDGFGRVYLKMEDENKYTIYKDQEMTMAVAVGAFADSSLTSTAREVNNSGLANIITLQRDGSEIAGHTAVIQLDYMQEDVTSVATGKQHSQGVDMSQLETSMDIDGVQSFELNGSYLSGIDLGHNTSETGNIYVKFTSNNAGANCQISLYSEESMNDDSLVAKSSADLNLTGATQAVRLYATRKDGEKYDSGLYGSFNIGSVTRDANISSMITSTMLAARVSSTEYGSKNFVSVEQEKGALWSYRDSTGNNHLIEAGLSGAKHTDYGADAEISVNGHETTLDGITGTAAGIDSTSRLVFNKGDLGLTTIAAVGYNRGTFGTRAGEMTYDATDKDNLICHATGSTTEKVDNFSGGMQFQLGEGSGDQERTVIGLKAMTAINLGKTYDPKTQKTLSLNDLLSGGKASLIDNPIKAMEIINNAIDEVSRLRADIGALQYNLLDTNENNLNIAIEKISRTESYIRDTDMAKESTLYSKNQIMVQASTSMLAQANQLSQNVISLIS